jgi:hypothetical protein
MNEKGTAIGVLTQLLGFWHYPVAYLSKQFDAISQGWPSCLRAPAATTVLMAKADKLTLGQEFTVQVPHSVLTHRAQGKLLADQLLDSQIPEYAM